VVLVLLAAPILKQKIKFKSIIALLISFFGVLVISTQGKITNFEINEPFGVFLALFSSVFWAFFWLLNVRDKRDEALKLFLNFSFAVIYIFIFMLLFSDFKINIEKSFWAAIYVGFFELGITFVVWLKALKHTQSADKISNLIFIAPALALFFIHFILGEKIYYTTYIGLFFILAGVYLVNRKKKTKM
ncbi:MAG: DMT family transporter, partial [Bacteroidota bacterium]|nr:DMT family transporter [Bacteroidota bacterium]